MKKSPKTFKQLQQEYKQKLEELQKSCTHKLLTPWTAVTYAPGHYTGSRVRLCKICNLLIYYEWLGRQCKSCGNLQPCSIVTCTQCGKDNSDEVLILDGHGKKQKITKYKHR